tara:strand:+ start:8818 stop:9585 length:768 start_codon:yes stop_codon:yes gene_type:complete
MITYYLEVLILSLVQGFFEFIPVSSSAHLIIISKISEFNMRSIEIDISLHLGSLIAIIFYFRKDFVNILNNKNLIYLIIFGSIPLALVGYFLYTTNLIEYFREIKIIAWTTLIFGILLYISDKFKVENYIEKHLTIKNILLIGFLQILALIPGVSRSGIVISAGRFLNFSRVDSAKISFYLSIPALIGASVLGLNDIFEKEFEFTYSILISIFLSFVFSYLTIKYFLIYLKNFSLNIFVYYRIFLALVLFIIIYN